MDTAQLQYFKAIAETDSLTKAAEKLHISQPAMSAMLKKFETELNAELFERTPNRIHLNSVGEIALKYANCILKDYEMMQEEIRNAVQSNLSLSVAFCDPGLRWFCVPRFSTAYPEIAIKDTLYETDDIISSLLNKTYDIIVAPHKIQHPDIQNVSFLHDQAYISVPEGNGLLGKETISLAEIPAQPILIPKIGGYFIAQIEKILSETNPQVTIVWNEMNIIQYLIRTTNFLTSISTLSIELRNDGVNRTLIPLSNPELNITYSISFLKSNRQKVDKFLKWATECTK